MTGNFIYDDFSGAGPSVNTDKWVVITSGGDSIVQSSGQVLITGKGAGFLYQTGIISKKAFFKTDVSGLWFTIQPDQSPIQDSVVGFQPGNTSISPYGVPDVIGVNLNWSDNHFFIVHPDAPGYVDTGFPYVPGTTYSINFRFSGNDVLVYVTGGIYTNQLIYTEIGSSTSPSVYAVAQTEGNTPGLYVYSVSSDVASSYAVYDDFYGTGPAVDSTRWTAFNSPGIDQTEGHVEITGTDSWNTTGIVSKRSLRLGSADVKFSLVPATTQNIMVGLQADPNVIDWGSPSVYVSFSGAGGQPLYQFINGSLSPLTQDWTAGVEYEVTFTFEGTNIKAYLDGGPYVHEFLLSTPDTTSSYMAVQAYPSAAPHSYITNTAYDVSKLTYFGSSSVADGTSANSLVGLGSVVSSIQSMGANQYFDSPAKIRRVDAIYTQQPDARQTKRIVHNYPGFVAPTSWTPFAHDGTWQKTSIRVYDWNDAVAIIPRPYITAGEDLTHSDGTMNLNT